MDHILASLDAASDLIEKSEQMKEPRRIGTFENAGAALVRGNAILRPGAWETCPSCAGSGLGLNMAGEPDCCRECKGDTVVRARDERGRWIPNPREEVSHDQG
jgi:DnaJ-class molecular chaperone